MSGLSTRREQAAALVRQALRNQLSTLDLQSLDLEALPEDLKAADAEFLIVNLRRNRLAVFPLELCRFQSMRVLILDENQLRMLPSELCECLTRLTKLSVARNLLVELPSDLTRLVSLESIDLAGNSMRELPASLARLPALRTVFFGANPAKSVPPELAARTDVQLLVDSAVRLPAGVVQWPARQIFAYLQALAAHRLLVDARAHWAASAAACQLCNSPFTLLLRRHHCRLCGRAACRRCSLLHTPLPALPDPQARLCVECHAQLTAPAPALPVSSASPAGSPLRPREASRIVAVEKLPPLQPKRAPSPNPGVRSPSPNPTGAAMRSPSPNPGGQAQAQSQGPPASPSTIARPGVGKLDLSRASRIDVGALQRSITADPSQAEAVLGQLREHIHHYEVCARTLRALTLLHDRSTSTPAPARQPRDLGAAADQCTRTAHQLRSLYAQLVRKLNLQDAPPLPDPPTLPSREVSGSTFVVRPPTSAAPAAAATAAATPAPALAPPSPRLPSVPPPMEAPPPPPPLPGAEPDGEDLPIVELDALLAEVLHSGAAPPRSPRVRVPTPPPMAPLVVVAARPGPALPGPLPPLSPPAPPSSSPKPTAAPADEDYDSDGGGSGVMRSPRYTLSSPQGTPDALALLQPRAQLPPGFGASGVPTLRRNESTWYENLALFTRQTVEAARATAAKAGEPLALPPGLFQQGVVVKAHAPRHNTELRLAEGALVVITDQSKPDRWFGMLLTDGSSGFFPPACVRMLPA